LRSIAVLGAGDLAATVVRRIAELGLARRVVLVDVDETHARGKALDIAQSGPVEGFDVQIEAASNLTAAGAFDALVVADPPELVPTLPPARARALAESLATVMGQRPLIVAAPAASAVIEAAVRGLSREAVVGSAPVARCRALPPARRGLQVGRGRFRPERAPPTSLRRRSACAGGVPWTGCRRSRCAAPPPASPAARRARWPWPPPPPASCVP
jgi:hypothetical protein